MVSVLSTTNNKRVLASQSTIELQGEQVLLTLNDDYVVLKGSMAVEVVSLLNQGASPDEIVASLSNLYPPEQLHFLLMRLEQDGYLVEHVPELNTSLSSFWGALDFRPGEVYNALATHSLALNVIGVEHNLGIKKDLKSMQVRLDGAASHALLLVDDYLNPQLEQYNAKAQKEDVSFLLAKPAGTSIWIGPVIHPHKATCWQCLKHRLALNRPANVFRNEQEIGGDHKGELMPPAMLQIARGLICLETVKWLSSPSPFYLQDTLLSMDLRTLEVERHACVHRLQCPVCGTGKSSGRTQVVLSKELPLLRREYTFRSASKKSTLDRYESLVSPVTGVVRSMRRVITEGTDLMHNYTVNHSGRLKGHSIESLRLATRDKSGGKGKTDIDAKVSGLCEALERFSAIYDDDPVACNGSYDSLGDEAIHPNTMLLFSEQQYDQREAWNREQSGKFQHVPKRFDPADTIAWTTVWSLSRQEPRYVPAAYCYYGFDGPGSQYCKADSNGLASGNTLEEAILYGFFELAERDAVSIWWYNKGRYPRVELSGFKDPYFDAIAAYFRSLNRELWVLDVTNDLGVPTFVAISPQLHAATQDILMGFGTHLDARTAITRAILEVNQSLPTVLRSAEQRRAQLLPDFADALEWWDTATVEQEPYLLPSPGVPVKNSG